MIDDETTERRPRRERGFDGPSKWLPKEEYIEDEVNPNEGLPFSRKWRIAVFGGSFDPVHLGHIKLARQVLEHDLADELIFVPAKHSPFKEMSQVDSGAMRLEMLNLAVGEALKEQPTYKRKLQDGRMVEMEYRFGVSDLELQRPGSCSYTYDTLMTLSRIYPDADLKFLMGTDCLNELMNWHEAGSLIQKFDFIIYPRPGFHAMSDVELIRTYKMYSGKLVRGRLSSTEFPVWDLSSTEVRRRIARHDDLSEYLSAPVWNYIQEHKLYQD